MLLCELPYNWNFQLYRWYDRHLPDEWDNSDYQGNQAMPWRYQCVTFDDDDYSFIGHPIMPTCADPHKDVCPQWRLPKRLPSHLSKSDVTAGWEREEFKRCRDGHRMTIHEVINGGRTADIPYPYPMFAWPYLLPE